MNEYLPFPEPTWTVTVLTRYLRGLLTNDDRLRDVWVQGEISNLSRPSSGHIYFTLKDTNCSLRCVMWRNTAIRLSFLPRDGEAVEVHGNIDIYEASGQYQLYADTIRPLGEGELFQEFLRLKNRLEAEGLFDPENKRPIPRLPKRIGVVTSPTGAALRDILNTINRRYPLVEVIVAPTPVQGFEAPEGIVKAINNLNQIASPDVILLARGGGSIEDLWAFNDERVARAIAASTSPIISGVGHETDFTIADFVSDLRAPTPTASAEMATPDKIDLLLNIQETVNDLHSTLTTLLTSLHLKLDRLQNRFTLNSPEYRLRSDRQRMDEYIYRLKSSISHQIQIENQHLQNLYSKMEAVNPQAILQRGYAILSLPGGEVVRSVTQVVPGDLLTARLADGELRLNNLE